jgi:hypothetical protein
MLQNQTALENHDSQNSLPFSSERNHYGHHFSIRVTAKLARSNDEEG